MPKLKNRLPGYCHHKASGQATVTLNAHVFYLGRYNSAASHSEYNRLIAEHFASGGIGGQTATDLTVAELLASFLAHAKLYYRKPDGRPTKTIESFKYVMKPLRELYGRTRVAQFGPLALKAVRQHMITGGVSRNYANQTTRRIRQIFAWGVENELVPPNILHGLKAVAALKAGRTEAPETPPILPISDEVVERTLPHVTEVVADMIRLQRITGARPAEICGIRPGDVDISKPIWLYRPVEHKTQHQGRERIICIGPRGQDILRPYLLRPADAYCFSPIESEKKRRAVQHANRKTPLTCGNRPGTNRKTAPKRPLGDCYTVASYRRVIHRACKLAFPAPEGLSEKQQLEWHSNHQWAPNQLRHSAATEIRKQFGLEAAQVALGHAQANVTQIYAERDLAKAIEIMTRIG